MALWWPCVRCVCSCAACAAVSVLLLCVALWPCVLCVLRAWYSVPPVVRAWPCVALVAVYGAMV